MIIFLYLILLVLRISYHVNGNKWIVQRNTQVNGPVFRSLNISTFHCLKTCNGLSIFRGPVITGPLRARCNSPVNLGLDPKQIATESFSFAFITLKAQE